MIITCDECSTSFSLDESLLKAEGSKVRCSLCKHVFTAFPPAPETIPEPETQEMLVTEIDATQPPEPEPEIQGQDMDEDEIDFDDMDFDIEDTGLEMDENDEADIEISFDSEDSDFNLEADLSLGMEEDDASSGELEFEYDDMTFEQEDIEFEKTEPDIENIKEEFKDIDQDIPEPVIEEDSAPDMEESKIVQDIDPPLETKPELELDSIDDPDLEFQYPEPEIPEDQITSKISDPDMDLEEADFELEFDMDDDPDTSRSFIQDTKDDDESDIPQKPSFTEDTQLDAIELETDFSAYDKVLDQDTEPGDSTFKPNESEDRVSMESKASETEPEPDSPTLIPEKGIETALIDKPEPEQLGLNLPTHRRSRKKSSLGAPIMVLVLVLFLIISAYIASLATGYKIPYLSDIRIPFVEQYLKKQPSEMAAAKPIPNQKSVNGRFVSNETAGELFIITGKIENPAQIPYNYIQIKGTLITKGKVKAITQTVFCGNIISEETLKTGNIADINKQLTIREGSHNSNIDIKPGTFVPFMIVFSNLPENLQNFTVEIVGFEKTDKTK